MPMCRFLFFFLFLLLSQLGTSQKTVLIEKFTNAFCGQCPHASILIDNLMEDYDRTIRVNHHKPVTWIHNPMNNDESAALWEDFQVVGVPSAMVDRVPINGHLVTTVANLEEGIASRLADQEAIVSIDLIDLNYDGEHKVLNFSISALFATVPPVGEYRLTVMMVEDSVRGVEQHSYYNDVPGHPLEGRGDIIWNYRHMDVVRKIMDGPWGTEGSLPVDLVAGESYVNQYTYQIPADQNTHKLRIVAMVSPYVEGDYQSRQILNAEEFRIEAYGLSTSVEDFEAEFTFIKSVSPNPVSSVVKFEFSEIPESILVFSTDGKLVEEIESNSRSVEMNTAQIENGFYNLIVSYRGQIYGYPFVIQR